MLVLVVGAGVERGFSFSNFVLRDDNFHVFYIDDFSTSAVERAAGRHVPALKLRAVARDSRESVVRTKVAGGAAVRSEVSESVFLLGLRSIEVGAIRELTRGERRLFQQNSAGAETR